MQTVPTETLLDRLNWRYATKQFDPNRKIPADAWQTLEKSLVLTPSSYGLQPWRFVVITDQDVKEQLVPHSWNQMQPAACSHFVVFAVRSELTEADVDAHLARVAEVRNVEIESLTAFRGMLIKSLVPPPEGFVIKRWAALQSYIALGNFMTCAAMIGVDTCPMEGIEPEKYDEILKLADQGYATVVACAAGYRSESDRNASLRKVRFAEADVIQHI